MLLSILIYQDDFADVIISTRVIVLLIAVRVKYGVSQSPGIVVFVLAPCHSRKFMPQCMEIFEGKHEKFEI